MATTTTTNNTTVTLASRAAGLLTKASALDVVSKAIDQALNAKRVHPAMAEDFAAQLGVDFPLKTRDFTRVVGHLLTASEKPLKGVISKRKSEILGILAEMVSALTDTPAIVLPAWALPKIKAKASEAEAEASEAEAAKGALDKANTLALAEAKAEAAEANAEAALSKAVSLIVARAADLTVSQRAMLASVLASTEASEAEAEAETSEAEA